MADATQAGSPARIAGKAKPTVPLSLSVDPASLDKLLDLFRETLETTLAKALSQHRQETLPNGSSAGEATQMPAAPSATTGVKLTFDDKAHAADLRIALLTGKTPSDSGLLIDIKMLSRLLSISKRTLFQLQSQEALPTAVRLGNSVRWRLAEILEWIEADCPPKHTWDQRLNGKAERKAK